MAKVRKHYNPTKRAKRILNNVRIWSWESMVEDGQRIAHGEAFYWPKWIDLSQKQVNGLIARSHNWAICCRAIYKYSDGNIVIESEYALERDLKMNDFAELYYQMRRRVVKPMDMEYLYDVGWLCHSFGSESQIEKQNLEMIHLNPITELRKLRWEQYKEC